MKFRDGGGGEAGVEEGREGYDMLRRERVSGH